MQNMRAALVKNSRATAPQSLGARYAEAIEQGETISEGRTTASRANQEGTGPVDRVAEMTALEGAAIPAEAISAIGVFWL